MSGVFLFGRTLSCLKRILSKEPFNNSATSVAVRYFSVTQSRNMKLVQFTYNDSPGVIRVGYVKEGGIVDVNKLDACLPTTLLDILRCGALDRVKHIKSQNPTPEPLSSVRLEAPITGQDKVLCVGLNYKDHCQEQNLKAPEVPMIFSKFASTVTGPNDPVKLRTGVTKCIKSRILSKEPFNNSATSIAVRYFSLAQSRNMKLVQFTYNDFPGVMRVGYLKECGIVDVNKLDACLPTTLLEILRYGALGRVKLIESQNRTADPLSSLRLEAPITGQDKVLCVGLNYKDHCEEHKLKAPKVPMIFSKFPSTVTGPNDPVKLRTDVTKKVDWEVELAVVIGKKASCVKAEDAYKYVLGYTVAQDISARDWQKERNSGQFLLGKAMDTFCPLGPWIVTCDEIPDPQCLDIRCSVNGVVKQTSNTCQLVHKIPDVIARLTSVMTLLPGDTILTGTPGGVGMYRSPPEYLQPGDHVTSDIQCIGTLETNIENYTL